VDLFLLAHEKKLMSIAPFTGIDLMLFIFFLLLVDISAVIIALKGPLHTRYSIQYSLRCCLLSSLSSAYSEAFLSQEWQRA
jgi:hypothetical protein